MEAKKLLINNGFTLEYESKEVLQFAGIGYVDLLLARRPISKNILKNANAGGPEDIRFVRAEDLIGLKIQAYKNDPSREFQDKVNFDLFFKFLEEYFSVFDFGQVKRKKMTGKFFLL